MSTQSNPDQMEQLLAQMAGLDQTIQAMRTQQTTLEARIADQQRELQREPGAQIARAMRNVKSHVAKPAVFDGKNFKVWWRTVEIYMRANSDDFENVSDKIVFVLSYMTGSNVAGMWAQNYIDKQSDATWRTLQWEPFVEAIKLAFMDKREAQKALEKLNGLKLGLSQSAEEFFAEFDILRRSCGHVGDGFDTDLIRLLRRALPDRILQHIDYRIPQVTTYEEWKTLALHMDGIWRSNRTDQTRQPIRTPFRPRAREEEKREEPRVPVALGSPRELPGVTQGSGVPMDIDRARRQGLCFNCQQRGHLARDCPEPRRRPYQVRQMIDPDNMSEDDYKFVIGKWEARKREEKPKIDVDQMTEEEKEVLRKKLF
jgi:hypothetical protein